MYSTSSSPAVTDCDFSFNSAGDGGGMYNNASSPTVLRVVFADNTVTGSGGGMYSYSSASPIITGSTFTNNAAGLASNEGLGGWNGELLLFADGDRDDLLEQLR